MAAIGQGPSSRLVFYRCINPVMRIRVRCGAAGRGTDLLRTLRVQGRNSGRIYDVPVRVAVIGGDRYVMTMLGDTQWARNLRASGMARLLYRRDSDVVRARELQGEDKTQFLVTLCQDPRFARRARAALRPLLGNNAKDLNGTAICLLGEIWHPFLLTPDPDLAAAPSRARP